MKVSSGENLWLSSGARRAAPLVPFLVITCSPDGDDPSRSHGGGTA